MKRVHVNSAAIRSIGYDEQSRTLEVRYIDGDLYRYTDVPPLLMEAFEAAPSKGKFINDIVKKYFPVEKIAHF